MNTYKNLKIPSLVEKERKDCYNIWGKSFEEMGCTEIDCTKCIGSYENRNKFNEWISTLPKTQIDKQETATPSKVQKMNFDYDEEDDCVGWGCRCDRCKDSARQHEEQQRHYELVRNCPDAKTAKILGLESRDFFNRNWRIHGDLKKLEEEELREKRREKRFYRRKSKTFSCLDIENDFDIETEEPKNQLFDAFKAGFEAGQTEQSKRDFPDVGISFDYDVQHYWEKYKKKGP